MTHRSVVLAPFALACLGLVSCSFEQSSTGSGTTAQGHLNSAPPAAAAPAAMPSSDHDHGRALHNVHHLGGKMISGAVPDGDAAFDELKSMGVRTIISVDGASPDVASAQARGIRYVHIPITYAEVSREEQLEIARAVRDLPGPIFIHCHHGKHRSPAATAAVAVTLGQATPDEAVAFMKAAGTSPHYTGLYGCVAAATVLSVQAIDAAPAEFPAVCKPEGVVACMVEVEVAYENLGETRVAGWRAPKHHPDLVPASEAGRLTDQLRFSGEDSKSRALGDDYARRLADAIAKAGDLEELLIAGAGTEQLEAAWKPVAASCKDCHAEYRDKKRQW